MDTNQRKFLNQDGDDLAITYRPLVRRDAMEIEYNTLGTIMDALSGSFHHVLALFSEVAKTEDGSVPIQSTLHVANAIASVHKSIPFEVLWGVAEKVLCGAVIEAPNRLGKIEELKDSDFFTDRIDEFVLAIFWGLDVSFPRAFSKARDLLSRLGEKKPGQTSAKESNVASTDQKPSTSQ